MGIGEGGMRAPQGQPGGSAEPAVVSGRTDRGELVGLRPLTEGEALPDEGEDRWTDWGEPLPLDQTVGAVHRLLVEVDGIPVGTVSWRPVWYGPNAGSQAWNIGIALAPSSRGRGVGSLAQRLLARHLLATTAAHRVEASTDVDNTPEQRALGKAGFVQEGVARGAQYRADGRHHDIVVYAVLRGEI